MDDPNSPPSGFISALKRMRWWIPLGIVILAIVNLVRLHYSSELDGNFKAMQSSMTFAVTLLLLVLWFAFFTRLQWRIRVSGLVLIALIGFGLTRVLRFDGAVDGTGTPRIVWKWKANSRNPGALNFVARTTATNAEAAQIEDSGYLGTNRNGVVEGMKLDRDWSAHPP